MRRVHAKHLKVATRQTPRAINRQIVLRLLRAHQAISRADLARLLGMQRSAAGRIVGDLIAQGLVREGAPGAADRGRKPTLLHLDSGGRGEELSIALAGGIHDARSAAMVAALAAPLAERGVAIGALLGTDERPAVRRTTTQAAS